MNKINSDFQLENKIQLKYSGRWPLPAPTLNKCLITSRKVTTEQLNSVLKIFNIRQTNVSESYLIVLSFDKLTVYTCLLNNKSGDSETKLVKLYTCPSEICNIEIVEQDNLYIQIGLKIGTLIRLSLKNILNKPDLVHLNTALHKYLYIKDTVIYTDGISMWKAENVFKENMLFTKFFVKHVKDFVNFGDQIICTSFSNMLYVFPLDDNNSYVKQETITEYCAAEKLLNNSEYLYKIMEEIEKNNELIKKINNEGNYITAFSISKRHDVMDNIIHNSIQVFESYEDVIKDNSDITLTENMHEYFNHNSVYILVKLAAVSLQHIFNNILSNILNDVKIHITFCTDTKLLKTTSIKVNETFKKLKVLLPLNMKDDDIAEIIVNIKLVSSIPGAFDERQKLWVTLYRDNVILKSEHFIKPNGANKTYTNLKEPIEPLADMIYKSALNQHGSLFNITDISKFHSYAKEFSVYCRLPNNYKDIFKDTSLMNYLEHLNKKKSTYILDQMKCNEFLRSESNISFNVGNVSVKLEIVNDDLSNPLMKITSINKLIAFNVRNFVANLIYNDATVCGNDKGNVIYSLYNTTENLLKKIKLALLNHCKYEEFQPIAENFEKNVFGALPI
ncbi:hypothetical protein evm_003635 [Chilo suppressalis]|nr:hypothetical protein evm_003635 [Chilo suppressalis]